MIYCEPIKPSVFIRFPHLWFHIAVWSRSVFESRAIVNAIRSLRRRLSKLSTFGFFDFFSLLLQLALLMSGDFWLEIEWVDLR